MNKVLTAEDIEFLRELANELRSQDSGTRKPVYYRIMEDSREYGIDKDYADGMYIIGDEGQTFTEVDEFVKWVISGWLDEDDKKDQEKITDLKEFEDLEYAYEYCKDELKVDSLTYTGYKKVKKYSEMFLTKKALTKHLNQNAHKYYKNNPRSYSYHVWRNPELERLLGIVDKFADVEED